jgi:ribosomal protein S18 acetylase RimI-like enzyme
MITCRVANTADIEAMLGLLAQLFAIETDFQINPLKQRAGLVLLLNSEQGQLFVAQDNDKVVAMCSVQILISTAEGGKVGLLEDLIVSRDYRHQGIGQQLLQYAINWAKQHHLKRLQLLADKNNQPALDFYARQQWHTTDLIVLRQLL